MNIVSLEVGEVAAAAVVVVVVVVVERTVFGRFGRGIQWHFA